MTHAELLCRISSRELSEWMALASLEPLGQERIELLLAQLLALTANVHRGEDDDPVSAWDFLPWWPDAAPASQTDGQSPEEMLAMAEMLVQAFGGQDLRQGDTVT
jgi:hypothetical protein